jgi:LPXTG-motif cell wall-anchored protein
VFSEPRTLGEVVTDADGSATFRIEIPRDLPAGPHTITIFGDAPDGSALLWAIPIVVGADGALTEVIVGETNVVTPPALPAPIPAPVAPFAPTGPGSTPNVTPSTGPLPATGSSPANALSLALLCAAMGAVLLAGSRRRAVRGRDRPDPT